MTRRTALKTLGAFALAAALPLTQPALGADAWPTRPITYVVPFTPGGSTDVIARTVAQKLSEVLGQPVIVENKPGAAGAIGAAYVAKAKPDGYTLFGGTISTHAINASLYKDLPYDPLKDFQPVTLVAFLPNVLIVNPIYAPAGTPREIVQRLNVEIVKILKSADVREKLGKQLGMELVGSTPEELTALMKTEIPRWAALVKKSGAAP